MIDWIVSEGWCSDEFTRESEKKRDEVFDPKSRQANREHHRLRWLEYPLMEFYARMLALANLKEVRVVGDGNCGFYAYLAAEGKLEHSQRARLIKHTFRC